MEQVLWNQFSIASITSFLRIAVTLTLFYFISKFSYALLQQYKKKKSLDDVLKSLPSFKIRFYNMIGHISVLRNHYIWDYPAPFHAYHSIFMTGIPRVYGKDGIFFFYQSFHRFVIGYHADIVELILNHSTEIKKSWFYRFLKPFLGEGLLTSDGSKWKQRRKMLTPAFHFNILKDFLPVINKQAKVFVNVVQGYTQSEAVDLVQLTTKCSFDIICETILGEEMHSQTVEDCEYLKSIAIILALIADRVLKPWLYPDWMFALSRNGWRLRRELRKAKRFTSELIARRKKEKLLLKRLGQSEEEDLVKEECVYQSRKRRALLDLLLEEHIRNNSISEEDIREEVDTFTFEGHDTTAMAMTWSLYLIGLHPEVQAKVHAELDSIFGKDDRDPTADDLREMKYLECVFKESLRLYPSVPGYGRQLQQDLEYKGRIIPKDTVCFVWAYLLHRDPEVFPNPEKFDPDRFAPEKNLDRHPFAYVPFSAGPRNCIGQKFAMMELKTVISWVLRKYNVRSMEHRDRVHDIFEITLKPYGGVKLEFRNRV